MAEKYLPLYRKYRPATFNEVVGQEVVVKTLLNAIAHNRVSHAYLFCGPRGTGKTSIARIFAKTLNCLNPKDGVPCGKCPHCIDMNNSVSMDVIEIDAASNRKVEDARNLLEKVQFLPVLGKHKIYIIDEVHMLTTEAFNTLLKTLEEPPENLIFILATTEAHKVLETIVSRCQKFDFRRISVNDIKNRLAEISQKENINIDDDALEFIARKSAGGLRDALALLDQSTVLALDNKSITKKDIINLLGSVDDKDLSAIANLIADKNPQDVLKLLKDILEKGNDPNQIIKELIGYFRNLMVASVCKNREEASKLLDISAENCEMILEQAKKFSAQELVQIIEQLSEQEKNIRNSSNPYLWLDVAIINAATRENIIAEKAILDRIEALENNSCGGFRPSYQKPEIKIQQPKQIEEPKIIKQEPKPVITAEPVKANKPDITDLQPKPIEPIKQQEEKTEPKIQSENSPITGKKPLVELNWDTFLGELQVNPAVYALVKAHAKPIITNSDVIELAFKNEIFIPKIKLKQQLLEDVAKKLCGCVPKLVFRKISEADFKKKILTEQNNTNQEKKEEVQPVRKDAGTIKPEPVTKEDIAEVKENITQENKKIQTNSLYNLSDDARQILEVFSGKVID